MTQFNQPLALPVSGAAVPGCSQGAVTRGKGRGRYSARSGRILGAARQDRGRIVTTAATIARAVPIPDQQPMATDEALRNPQ